MAKTRNGNSQENIRSRKAPGRWDSFSIGDFRPQAIVLAIIAFVFYCNTFFGEAAFDDRMAITDNEYVQEGIAGIHDILTRDSYASYLEQKNAANQLAGGRYRPLSLITFAIEQQLLGVSDGAANADQSTKMASDMHVRHVVNVLLYMLSVMVLLYLFRKIILPNDPVAAFAAALLFTILPVHSEVVANVKSRDEILSLLFICLTFIKAHRYKQGGKTSQLVLALICFFLALLAKEYAATLLVLLPLSFYVFRKETMKGSFKSALLYLLPFALYIVLRLNAVNGMAQGAGNSVLNNPYLYATAPQAIATKIFVLLDYLRLLVFPNILAADYSYAQIPYTDFGNMLVWLSLLLYLALGFAMVVLLRGRNVLGFAIAFYLANLVLVSNFFFNIGAPMGERLIYHSSVGFCIAAGYLIGKGHRRAGHKVGMIVWTSAAIVVTGLCGFRTIERNADWKNDNTLFLTDVKTVANSALVNNNAAAACMAEAKRNVDNITVRTQWMQRAIGYFDKAISIYPQYYTAMLNRGLCYFNTGNADKALPDWDTVRKYKPADLNLQKYLQITGKYFYTRGAQYEQSGKMDSAIIAFGKCADATPDIPAAWFNLGNAYYLAGDIQYAKAALKRALQLAPNYDEARILYAKLVAATKK